MQRPPKCMDRTNCMEGNNSMSRGKRSLEGEDEQQPERKRPALASVIVEALKVDSLQKLCSSLEPILRRVVSEEVERALAKLAPARLNGRSSPRRIEGPDGRNLQLQFRSRLALPLFTGGKIEGEQGAAIHVILIDANTGHVVTSGPEASAKLDVVVLEGDFNNEDDEGWTEEEFESHLVKEREGKRPLLTGDLQVTLKDGVGTLGELIFTDNSSWIRSRKFRLGLKVSSGYCEGMRIREAKTEAFNVKDHRGELYKKHYPPALSDEVWRLEKIGKDGAFHKKLNSSGINTVEEFLRVMAKDSQRLRSILGSGMSNRMWETLVEHAKTTALSASGKLYVYYAEDSRNVGVLFNNIYELSGFISGEQYIPADSLSESQKVYVDALVKKAYENWNRVIDYDAETLVNFKQRTSSDELPAGRVENANAYENQQLMQPLPVSVPVGQPSVASGVTVGGYNQNMAARYAIQHQPQLMNSNSRAHFENAPFATQNHLISSLHNAQATVNGNNSVGLALALPQSSSSGFQSIASSMQPSNLTAFDDWSGIRDKGVDELFTEEEIRIRSNEMLENEDMQHLLRLFSMGNHANVAEEGFTFPSYIQTPMQSFDEDRNRSGKAVVGWLKIKAAMRWGFFIRKKAAERRAQIVELEDDE